MYSNFRDFQIANNYLPEVLFTGQHVTHLPWGMYDEWNNIPLLGNITELPLQNVHIRAKKLCHITHNQPAGEIDKDQDYFEFKPAPKVGRAAGQKTYAIRQPIDQATPPTDETIYRPVTSDESLFPGYCSWWSIDNVDHDPTSNLEHYYFSDLFTSSSRYGNNKFSGNIVELLQSYQKAFDPLPRIQFRCGGTLRYKQEICKVVIVCTDASPLDEDEFPRMWKDYVTEEEGVETTLIASIEVVIRNGITGAKTDPKYTPYSWDTYAFCFYFPDGSYKLKCPRSVIQRSEVDHNVRFCVPKVNRTCPNLLDDQDEN